MVEARRLPQRTVARLSPATPCLSFVYECGGNSAIRVNIADVRVYELRVNHARLSKKIMQFMQFMHGLTQPVDDKTFTVFLSID